MTSTPYTIVGQKQYNKLFGGVNRGIYYPKKSYYISKSYFEKDCQVAIKMISYQIILRLYWIKVFNIYDNNHIKRIYECFDGIQLIKKEMLISDNNFKKIINDEQIVVI